MLMIQVREFNVDNLVVLKSLVRCLELVSGLKVNIHKSRFGGLGVAREGVGNVGSLILTFQKTVNFIT